MAVAQSGPKLEGACEQRGSASGDVQQEPKAIRPEPSEVSLANVEREVLNRGDVVVETLVR